MSQLSLPLALVHTEPDHAHLATRDRLQVLLQEDFDFQGQYAAHATHNLHPFPAKFPPQLPRRFIQALTQPGDVVLDPMMGSGTTVLEAYLAQRTAVGFDIDPLARLLAQVKVTPLPLDQTARTAAEVVVEARTALAQPDAAAQSLDQRFNAKSREFIHYWFPVQSQLELAALIQSIEQVESPAIRAFLQLAFSATIITKSAGVSLARDLAHTRPHKVKEAEWRSPLGLFEKRVAQNLNAFAAMAWTDRTTRLEAGDAQQLPLPAASVDLIVTSPPYASNAIDYMRAHKFSLVWLGYPIEDLSQRRREYVGGEALDDFKFEPLPSYTAEVVAAVEQADPRKGRVLHRYYSEMTRVLREMRRVLKPGRCTILVVGTSTFKGQATHVQHCLGDIGQALGLDLVGIAERRIDRNRRMLPARHGGRNASQIEERMHEEYLIGFQKLQCRAD